MHRSAFCLASIMVCAIAVAAAAAPKPPPMPNVRAGQRFLFTEESTPFFYLGDTAWELFHRLGREDAERYLKDRAAKGFTVIQAVVLAEFAGLTEPNPDGQLPLKDNDPTKPNELYFQHVDWVVQKAAQLGLRIGMLPTWGDKWNKKWGKGPEIFTPENAATYGEWLGNRYKDQPIVWILGGDRPVENERHKEILRALAAGLKKGDGGKHPMTFHPMGGHSSAEWLHDEKWLNFNMLQSGHGRRDLANYEMIARDYARKPAKPCLDGEACYEDHPINWKPENGWFDDYDVRKTGYWAVFAGACGHTYGCHDIWQFLSDARPPVSSARTPWQKALNLPGSSQVGHLRRLVHSRPFWHRVPDQSLIAGDTLKGTDHIQACPRPRRQLRFHLLRLRQAVHRGSEQVDRRAAAGVVVRSADGHGEGRRRPGPGREEGLHTPVERPRRRLDSGAG
jgi:Protein of unknown function (DUF4038)